MRKGKGKGNLHLSTRSFVRSSCRFPILSFFRQPSQHAADFRLFPEKHRLMAVPDQS